MKVKEFLKKYKEYSIELQGKPLDQMVIPYTHLPKDKPLNECEVVDYTIEEKEHEEHRFSFNDLKHKSTEIKKGYIRAYVK